MGSTLVASLELLGKVSEGEMRTRQTKFSVGKKSEIADETGMFFPNGARSASAFAHITGVTGARLFSTWKPIVVIVSAACPSSPSNAVTCWAELVSDLDGRPIASVVNSAELLNQALVLKNRYRLSLGKFRAEIVTG